MSNQLMMAPAAGQHSQQQQQQHSELTEAQSLALVKIFLNSSLACICHTRELIDWQSNCFRKRYIDHIDLDDKDAYHNFCNRDPDAPGSSQEVRVLVRSGNIQANGILNMIEHGVLEAIEKGCLDTLQVFITTDSAGSHAIRETYTYRFSYYGNAVASVELKEQQQYLTMADAQRSFKTAIRCLLRAVKYLPRLPAKRSLGMSLAYNHNCPDDYEPAGFVDAANHKILQEDWDKLWNDAGHPVSNFDASHHNVNVTARNSMFGYQTASQMQDTVISKQLQDFQKTSSTGHQGLVSTLPAAALSPARSAMPTHRSSERVARSFPYSTRVSKTRKAKSKNMTRSKSDSLVASVQHVPKATNKNPMHGFAILAKSRRRRDIGPTKLAETIVHAHCLDFEAQDGGTLFDPDLLARGVMSRLRPGDAIRCECGYQRACETMVFCNLCNTWQHSQCYGLTLTARQKSRPSQHLCYSCLLLPKEMDVLAGMPELVHMRLALMYISSLQDDKLDLADFCANVFGKTSANAEQIDKIIKRLVADKVIARQHDGMARVLKLAPEQAKKLQIEILDPLAAISQHYRTVKDTDKAPFIAAELDAEVMRYTGGCDYSKGVGVEDVIVIDSFGHAVVRWGFYTSVTKRKVTIQGDGQPSPRLRRISLSRAFINLDRSTPASSLSFDEDESLRPGQESLGSSPTSTEF